MKINDELIQDFGAYYSLTVSLFTEDREQLATEEELKGHRDLSQAFNAVYPGILMEVKRFIDNYNWIEANIDHLQMHQVEHYIDYLNDITDNDDLGVCIVVMDASMITTFATMLGDRKADLLLRATNGNSNV